MENNCLHVSNQPKKFHCDICLKMLPCSPFFGLKCLNSATQIFSTSAANTHCFFCLLNEFFFCFLILQRRSRTGRFSPAPPTAEMDSRPRWMESVSQRENSFSRYSNSTLDVSQYSSVCMCVTVYFHHFFRL